jgi:uncharacterized protein (TIGR02246 family)
MEEDMIATKVAEWSCSKAIHKYAKAADSNDAEMFLDAFTPEGVWVRPDGQELKGHAALRAFLLARPSGGFARHIVTNIVVDVMDSENATATSIAVVLKAKPPVSLPLQVAPATMLAYYEDQLRRCEDGHWRISHRRVTLQMDVPASTIGSISKAAAQAED